MMGLTYKLDVNALHKLYDRLQLEGEIIAPTQKDSVIRYDISPRFEDLPQGWTEIQGPGLYQLKASKTKAIFSYTVAPSSWKRFLYPPKETLFSSIKNQDGLQIQTPALEQKSRVLFGVRPCELRAIRVQEKVFSNAEYTSYQNRLDQSFIVAVACTTPGANCFCKDVESGPDIKDACDLKIIEWGSEPNYLLWADSAKGENILQELSFPEASPQEKADASEAVSKAKQQMGREFDRSRSKDLLVRQYTHPAFEEIAARCTACGNCTLVCPTCFCSNIEDHTSLDGNSASRVRTWDSCFTLDFTEIHGSHARVNTSERYRQWITHKLSNWEIQFDEPGCVGCGRCITWCPEGIDITDEFKKLIAAHKEPIIRYKELT